MAGNDILKNRYETIIIGGGPAGLSAAYHLNSDDYLLLEQAERVGGLGRSEQVESPKGNFSFDYAGHIMFTTNAYVRELWQKLLSADNVLQHRREAWTYSHGVYTRYPFQSSLYELPPEVVRECLAGVVRASYGSLFDAEKPAEPQDFEAWIYATWGQGIAHHFMIPYNRKLWTVPLTMIDCDWLRERVPQPNVKDIVYYALHPQPPGYRTGANAQFGYPRHGGFESIMRGFLPFLHGSIRTGCQVIGIDPAQKRVSWRDHATGAEYEVGYERLVNTMPLPVLVESVAGVPAYVRTAGRNLKYNSLYCVNLGIDRPDITDKHWIYYSEDTVFHRIFVQSNTSPHLQPAGTSSFICEISYSPYKPITKEGLVERAVQDCIKVGLLTPEDRLLCSEVRDIPFAYVVYDHERRNNAGVVLSWLKSRQIYSAGRWGEWKYYNTDQAILSGKRAVEQLQASQQGNSQQATHAKGR